MSLFTELKNRNVIKVAVIYVATAWLLLQVIDTLQESLRLPDWSLNLFLALALFGFPLALILSWAVDLSPQGIQKADDTQTSTRAKVMFTLLIVVVLLGVGVSLKVNWQLAEPEYVPAVQHSNNPQGLASQAAVIDQSIAVLPFVNMSGNPENEYFSDGISEELLHGLTNLEGDLRVVARTSSFYFKGKDVDIATIGEKLNVATVLEGSVRRAGNRVRITAQLINVADGYHLWSETYDRTLDDIFAVQDEIARAIVEALKVELSISPTGPLLVSGTNNPAAYAAYLQGVYYMQQGLPPRAVEHLRQATELDPDYANAWGQLSATNMNLSVTRPWDETVPYGKRAFERALALDSDNGYALASKGEYTLRTTWDWAASTGYFQRALRSKADHAQIVTSYANVILVPLGQTQRARELYSQVLSNDPFNRGVQSGLLLMDIFNSKYQAVVDATHRLEVEGEDNSILYTFRCLSYSQSGDASSLNAFIEKVATPPACTAMQAVANGDTLVMKVMLASLELVGERNSLTDLAKKFLNIGLGNMEEAMMLWEQEYERRDVIVRYIRAVFRQSELDALRPNPRFQALLEKTNLDDESLAQLERTIDF